jgi:hypothetical protein
LEKGGCRCSGRYPLTPRLRGGRRRKASRRCYTSEAVAHEEVLMDKKNVAGKTASGKLGVHRFGEPNSEEGKRLVADARLRCAQMSEIEHAAGFAAPEDCGSEADTACMALGCAISTGEWTIAAEAFVLLQAWCERTRAQRARS